jgi:hypothetical protein
MSSTITRRRGRDVKRASNFNWSMAVQCSLGLLAVLFLAVAGVGSALANTHTIENLTNTDHEYMTTVTYQVGGHGSVTLTFTVPANSSVQIGGKNGIGSSKNQEIIGPIPSVIQTADLGPSFGASLTTVANEPQFDTGQLGFIVTGLDGSPVYSFFDFALANYQQLDANVPFVFAGLTAGGEPILDLASDPSTQITDSSGDLLSQYSFTAETVEIASIAVAAPVPEPSTWAFILIGFVGMGSMTYRQRKRKGAPAVA